MKNLPQIAFDFAEDKNARQNEPAELSSSPAQSPQHEQTAGVGVRLKHTKNTNPEEMKNLEREHTEPASGQPPVEKITTKEATIIEATVIEATVIEATFIGIGAVEEPAGEDPPPGKAAKSTRGRKSLKQVAAEADLIVIPEDAELFGKQYYTMGEVAAMFRVNQSLLRFWESEFNILQPRKNKKGDRYFRPVDIKNLHLIYHLLRQRKYTIEGAKEFLKNSKKGEARFEAIRRLRDIKAFLLELKAQI